MIQQAPSSVTTPVLRPPHEPITTRCPSRNSRFILVCVKHIQDTYVMYLHDNPQDSTLCISVWHTHDVFVYDIHIMYLFSKSQSILGCVKQIHYVYVIHSHDHPCTTPSAGTYHHSLLVEQFLVYWSMCKIYTCYICHTLKIYTSYKCHTFKHTWYVCHTRYIHEKYLIHSYIHDVYVIHSYIHDIYVIHSYIHDIYVIHSRCIHDIYVIHSYTHNIHVIHSYIHDTHVIHSRPPLYFTLP